MIFTVEFGKPNVKELNNFAKKTVKTKMIVFILSILIVIYNWPHLLLLLNNILVLSLFIKVVLNSGLVSEFFSEIVKII